MLTDVSIMPWGKHKGLPLGEVADRYWEWFLQQEWAGFHRQLRDYAQHRIPYIEPALTDEEKPHPVYVPGIVTHPEMLAPWEEEVALE